MSSNFKRIVALLDHWPIDHNKARRDLGQFLRDNLHKSYKEGKLAVDAQHWDRQYIAIQRLINNEHQKKYPRRLQSSATGLTLEQCSVALSNEFLEHLEHEDRSFLQKLFTPNKLKSEN